MTTQIDAYARRRGVASDVISCTSRGVLEEAIVPRPAAPPRGRGRRALSIIYPSH